MSSKEVSKSPDLTRGQPAVVAPELADENGAPVPEIGQDAQTGPEIVGEEVPNRDSVKKKKTLFQKLGSLFKMSK